VEVTAHAVGADQHQRVNGIAGRLQHIRRAEIDALGLRLGLDGVAELLLGVTPVAGQRGDQLAVGMREIGRLPRRPLRASCAVAVLQALEECLPLGIDRAGVGGVAGLEVFDVGGVAAIEKRRMCERSVRVLARHGGSLLRGTCPGPAAHRQANPRPPMWNL
jgi:hypothetical protein